MAAAGEVLTPTEYISHHLTFFTKPVAGGSFWALNVDTVVTSIVLGILGLGFFWWVARGATAGVPSKRQAFVELAVEFIDDQVKGVFHGDRHKFLAPTALTVFVWVLLMNSMDFLPVDVMAWIYEHVFHAHNWRGVPTADVNTTFALSLSVLVLEHLLRHQGQGAGRLDPRVVLRAIRIALSAVAVQLPVQSRRVRLQAAVPLAASVRQHVRGRDHLPASVAVGSHRLDRRPLLRSCSDWAGPSSIS